MNTKNIIFFTIIWLLLTATSKAETKKTFIVLKINNEIITNQDIEFEKKYLSTVNANFSLLTDKQLIQIAEDSIIREKIKSNEISKYYELDVYPKYLDTLIVDFYTKLNFDNVDDFNNYLIDKKITLDVVKKKLNIEALWNKLIYQKYNGQVEIDKKKLVEKVDNIALNKKNELISMSEIVFEGNSTSEIEEKHKKILDSIQVNGFEKTANIFSISNTAKFGGNIGWVSTSKISSNIYKKLKKVETGDHSSLIKIPGGFLILKVNDKKTEQVEIDKDTELKKLISYERDNQLNQFSLVYFQKIKKNSLINEL